jgi:hypothetical protein
MNPQHFTISLPPSSMKMMSQSATPSPFPSHFSEEMHRLFGPDFFHILFITFLLSEILFTVLPVENVRLKQVIVVAIGALLGATLIHKGSMIDALLQGALSGLSVVIILRRFGTQSVAHCQRAQEKEECVVPSHPEHL